MTGRANLIADAKSTQRKMEEEQWEHDKVVVRRDTKIPLGGGEYLEDPFASEEQVQSLEYFREKIGEIKKHAAAINDTIAIIESHPDIIAKLLKEAEKEDQERKNRQ